MTDAFTPAGYVEFPWSFAILLGLLGVGWGALVLTMIGRAWRLRRLQEHEDAFMRERASWKLSAGPSRVVHGRVEVEGEPVAIEIDVMQTVKDCANKNGRWHEWVESWRKVEARPFRLITADGQRVLVEPDDGVLVVDTLATKYPIDQPSLRVRSATVRADEEVYVYGDLLEAPGGGAYRGGASFVLSRPRRGRMLVATEAIRDRYKKRIVYATRVGVALACTFVLAHGLVTTPFLAALLFGTREEATVTNARTYVTSSKNGPITHFEITARDADGFALSADVHTDVYYPLARSFAAGESPKVPMLRVGDSTWASYLGGEPCVHIGALVLVTAVAAMAAVAAFARWEQSLPWYDRRKVQEYGGPGQWVETRRPDGHGAPIDPARN